MNNFYPPSIFPPFFTNNSRPQYSSNQSFRRDGFNNFKQTNYYNSNNYNQKNYNSNNNNSNNCNTCNYKNDNSSEYINIFGIQLHSDDVLILALLFFLYQEEVKDTYLFIALLMLLLS